MKKLIETIIIMIVNFVQLSKGYIYNNFGEAEIPDKVIRDIAKALLPNIIDYLNSEKGKAEFAEWKRNRDKIKESAGR